MLKKVGLYLVGFIGLIVMSYAAVFASDIQVDFAQKEGIPLSTSSVSVIKAEGIKEDGGYRITGMLKRLHRLSMGGHLHVFALDEKGKITSESKHRVHGLHNAGKGTKRIPFNVLVSTFPESTSSFFIEHHRPGSHEG